MREKWENGTPFCYFETGSSTVVSTYEGRALSLVRKLGLVGSVHLLDTPEVTNSFVTDGILTTGQAKAINNTQFRSLEFLQIAARELVGGRPLPAEEVELEEHSFVEGRAWFIDNFHNVKTTLLPEDIGYEEGKTVTLAGGQEVVCYRRLTDVPNEEFGLTVGSSGYGGYRWLEIAKQQGRAAEDLGLTVGSGVLGA